MNCSTATGDFLSKTLDCVESPCVGGFSITMMWGIPETHPVAIADISSSCCRGLTCSLSLKLALQVEGPSTFSITQEMFGESLLKAC